MYGITSYEYRNNPLFLRNQFSGAGMFKLPLIKKQKVDLKDVGFIGYDKVGQSDEYDSIVHFFLDDYRFESVYKNPDGKIERLKQFKAVLTPDFSMYTEMPIALQMYNCFKNRWTGAYFQQQGITVIPTVRWGNLASFSFCFDGIEKGCTVAVSTLGVRSEKSYFLLGYDEMRSRVKPAKIICYGEPFDEMKGDIIVVDYAKTNNLKAFSGYFVKKCSGYVESIYKGGGSASGTGSANPKPEESIEGNQTQETSDAPKSDEGERIPEKELSELPEEVQESYRKYEESGWKGSRNDQTPGTKGGGKYENDPPTLPQKDSLGQKIEYRKYDVNNKQPNTGRDAQRFVRGSNGDVYYTDDHYGTFTKIK